jgi:DNA uptake protein ComE-like DNA-binding protein
MRGALARARLDLNTASAADLAKLPRMTKGLARKVVENRPYDEVRELVNRNIVPGNVYDAIKSRVEVNAP